MPTLGDQVLPGGSSLRYPTGSDAEPVAKAKPSSGSKPSSGTKVKYTGEPKEDDKWLGLHNKFKYDIETKAKGSVRRPALTPFAAHFEILVGFCTVYTQVVRQRHQALQIEGALQHHCDQFPTV
jgi:hypothetical protein